MDFGEAIRHLKGGYKVGRRGWNGRGMWLRLVPGGLAIIDGGTTPIAMLPYIAMKTVDDTFVPWLASQTDVLGEDWEHVP